MELAESRRFTVNDFHEIFDLRDSAGSPYLLIGGQAVNYWAERYLNAEPELKEFLPFTSEDIDFKGTRADVQLIADQLGYQPIFPPKIEMTALAGAIPISLRTAQSNIEVVRRVPGVSNHELETMSLEAEHHGKRIRVMDPVSLTASKLKLVFSISQEKRQDVPHLKIMVVCVRGFLREILAPIEAGRMPAAGWLGAANKMRKLATSYRGRKATKEHGVEWPKFLPIMEIGLVRNEKIVRFREVQLPHWWKTWTASSRS